MMQTRGMSQRHDDGEFIFVQTNEGNNEKSNRVIVISDGLVSIIDNDTGLVASISLETLS